MNRRSFLGLGLRCVALGAALSTGLSITRLRQVNEYSVLYKFADKLAVLYEDDIPPEIKDQAFQRMGIIAEAKQGVIVGHRIIHVPPAQKDMSDPLGQYGIFGFTFNLEEYV